MTTMGIDPIGPVHMQSQGFGTDSGQLWIAKKDIASDSIALRNTYDLVCIPGGTVKIGRTDGQGWIRTDGDECAEMPDYKYIVVQRGN